MKPKLHKPEVVDEIEKVSEKKSENLFGDCVNGILKVLTDNKASFEVSVLALELVKKRLIETLEYNMMENQKKK